MKAEIKDIENDTLSETGTVGTIIQHPDYILHSDFLKPKHFKDRSLATIYYVIETLYNKGIEEIDSFIITNEIFGNKKLKATYEEKGFKTEEKIIEYIEDLKLVSRSCIDEYKLIAKKVLTNSFKRDSVAKLIEIANNIASSTEELNITNRHMQTEINDFSRLYVSNDEVKKLGEKVDKIMDGIKRKWQRGFFGYPTIFSELDKYINYTEEDLVCYRAGAKSYKSILLMNQGITLACNGIPTMYIDTENSETLHTLRVLSYLTGIEFMKIRDGKLSIAEEKMIAEKVEFIKTLPYVHIYDNIANMDDMYTKARSLVIRNGLKVIIHDYLKNTKSNGDDYNALGDITMQLKNLCGDLKLAGITASQNNRGGELADSIKVLRYVSSMVKLEKKTKEDIITDGLDAGNMRLAVTDNRNGNSHAEGEFINLFADGDRCRLSVAKIATSEGLSPFN